MRQMLSFFKKTKLSGIAPNILITNFCNQHCAYCFAKENFKKNKQKQLSLIDFKRLIKILKKNNVNSLRLLGGEPTLHESFQDFVRLGLKNFKEVWIFTNGFFPKEIDDFFRKVNSKNLSFVFNLDTPAFNSSKQKRREVEKKIIEYSSFAKIYSGFTISKIDRNYAEIYRNFSPEILKKINVRFGIMKPIIGEKPFFDSSMHREKRAVGKQIISVVENLKKIGIDNISTDCGLMMGMFTFGQKEYLEKNVNMRGYECDGYWGNFDIDTDLSAFPCFPYSQSNRIPIDENSNFRKIFKEFSCKKMCLAQDQEKFKK
jgi:organic radical activating enzyme